LDHRRTGRFAAVGTRDVRTAIAASTLSFVCVGTPKAEDGSALLTQIEQAIGAIGDALRATGPDHTVVMCSTVRLEPRSNSAFHCWRLDRDVRAARPALCGQPEFLREAPAVRDFESPSMILAASSDRAMPRRCGQRIKGSTHRSGSRRTAPSKASSCCPTCITPQVAFANEAPRCWPPMRSMCADAFSHFCADDVLNISQPICGPASRSAGTA